MTAGAGSAAWAGRSARGSGMDGIVPFGALDVVGHCVVTLRAGARAVTDGDGIGISRYAMRKHMLTAGTVTVFALDVGQALQLRRHAGPVAIGQHGRESPAVQRRHVVKAAVVGKRVGIVAIHVAGDAALAVVAADQAVDGPGEERGMGRIRVSGVNAGHTYETAAVTGSAGINAKISGRRNGGGDVRRGRDDVRPT